MIQKAESFSGIPRDSLPFPVYTATRLPFTDLSIRVNDEKWPSVRFFVHSGGKKFRVKEFFLDWFFTGFPKSLLRDFSSSYSPVVTFSKRGTVFYYGKNYHGLDSVSGFVYGTQVEIECESPATAGEFTEVVGDLLSNMPDPVPPDRMQFPDRSHSAKGHSGEWFENRRISRLKWYRTAREDYPMSGHSMRSSGIGNLTVDGQWHTILILEEGGYRNAVWAESASSGLDISNAIYNVRKGSGFYSRFSVIPGGSLLFRENKGPGILRIMDGDQTWTIGFSPGFTSEEILDFSRKLAEFSTFLNSTLESAAHSNA